MTEKLPTLTVKASELLVQLDDFRVVAQTLENKSVRYIIEKLDLDALHHASWRVLEVIEEQPFYTGDKLDFLYALLSTMLQWKTSQQK